MEENLYEFDRDRGSNPWATHSKYSKYVGIHFHYMLEIIYALDDGFLVNTDNEWISLRSEDYICINCGVPHATRNDRGIPHYVVSIPKYVLSPALQIMKQNYCLMHDDAERNMRKMLSCLRSMTSGTNKDVSVARQLFLTSISNSIMSYIFMNKSDLPDRIRHPEPFFTIINYICDNYRNPELDTAYLAKHFGYTPRMLSDMFMKNLRIGVRKYIDTLRINDAQYRLLSTTDNIDLIASLVGFESVRSFYRVFTAHTGMAPGLWRQGDKGT